MSDAKVNAASDEGLVRTESGLIVPGSLVTREVEEWTAEDRRDFERMCNLANRHGLMVIFTCPDLRCATKPLVEQVDFLHVRILRCQHKDRHIGITAVERKAMEKAIARRARKLAKQQELAPSGQPESSIQIGPTETTVLLEP